MGKKSDRYLDRINELMGLVVGAHIAYSNNTNPEMLLRDLIQTAQEGHQRFLRETQQDKDNG